MNKEIPGGPRLLEPQYRPDIDGLRAIAVLSVIGFHLFPEHVKGGFVGVDIFFVISGFLITTIIIKKLDDKEWNYVEFYCRRIKRIFPVLTLVLGGAMVYGWQNLMPAEFELLGKHVSAGAAFVPNFTFWSETGYFEVNAIYKPLWHLWSLGIEEQFYLIWPLTLAVLWKRKHSLLKIMLFIAGLSFAINLYFVDAHPVAAFYSPVSRFWELMVGGILAYFALYKPQYLSPKPNLQSFAGFGLIFLAVILINKNRTFPGYWALMPTLGTFLVISAGPDAWPNRKFLSNKIIVGVGLISYGLYLWHWPLLSFAYYDALLDGMRTLTRTARITIFFESFVLAWITYKLVEHPIRFGRLNRKGSVFVLVLVMTAVGLLGYRTFVAGGYLERVHPGVAALLDDRPSAEMQGWRESKCFLLPNEKTFSSECVDANKRPLIFLWGDSHAGAFYPGLKALQETYNFGIGQYTAIGCGPLVGFENMYYPVCKELNDGTLAQIKKVRPDLVILHARWFWFGYDISSSKIEATVNELRKSGVTNIVLLGSVPHWHPNLPRVIWNNWRRYPFGGPPPQYMPSSPDEGSSRQDDSLRAIANGLGIKYISAYRSMCNGEGCLTRIGYDKIASFDDGHLTPVASRYLAEEIRDELFQGLKFTATEERR